MNPALPAVPSRVSVAPRVGGMDLARQRMLCRMVQDEGMDPFRAWVRVCLDPGFGFGRWRGAPSIPDSVAMKKWQAWAERTGDSSLALARQASAAVLASATVPAAVTLSRMIERVDAEDIDAERVRLAAAKTVLEFAGHGKPSKDSGAGVVVQVAQTVTGGGGTDAELALVARMQETPEGRDALAALERWHLAESAREARRTEAEVR